MIPVRQVIRKVGGYHLVAALEGEELKMEIIPPDGPEQSQAIFSHDTLPPLARPRGPDCLFTGGHSRTTQHRFLLRRRSTSRRHWSVWQRVHPDSHVGSARSHWNELSRRARDGIDSRSGVSTQSRDVDERSEPVPRLRAAGHGHHVS